MATPAPAAAGRTFASGIPLQQDGFTPPRTMTASTAMIPAPPQKRSATEVFAITMLSHAEKALRGSSSTAAPNDCCGCTGVFEDNKHLFKDCPHKDDTRVQHNFKIKLEEFLARKRRTRFDPRAHKKDGFSSNRAASLFNDICDPDLGASSRQTLVSTFITEQNKHAVTSLSSLRSRTRDNKDKDGSGVISLPFWVVNEAAFQALLDDDHWVQVQSFNANVQQDGFTFRYPITVELPHTDIPIGKNAEATAEGMLDTGGACTMGDLGYWKEVTLRMPNVVAHFEELAQHQEKPIQIGGVGSGSVLITHVIGLWLPWTIGGEDTKLVIGLGENMPMTLLIGLPFQIAAQVNIDIGNLKCYSKTFDTTWKMTLKRPQRKDIRTLDAIMSTGKRAAFPVLSAITTAPKKPKWNWEVVEVDQE